MDSMAGRRSVASTAAANGHGGRAEGTVLERSGKGPERPAEEAKQAEAVEGALPPPEMTGLHIPQHWHAKPAVHVTCIGGQLKEEEIMSLFSPYGQLSSISFENERRDSAVIRYEYCAGDAEALLPIVCMAINNTKLEDRILTVEPFRPDSLLFVGNLTAKIDDCSLIKMFQPHGRVERAFVVQNAAGQSKCYGFVEYSLKGQSATAKLALGNINMEGRVLRVEWCHCRAITDMFSAILFVDRLPKENSYIEKSLRDLFGKYGQVKDCYVAVDMNNQFRGFAFIEFSHSLYADRAHQALDGYELDGSHIRVSFGNPSKSVQSYKLRVGSTAISSSIGGGTGDNTLPSSGMFPIRSYGSRIGVPQLASQLMGQPRPGILGAGCGLPIGRGTIGGSCLLGPGSAAGGIRGMAPLLLASRSGTSFMASPITSAAIMQVATAQAKAREEARAEAGNQGLHKESTSMHTAAIQQNVYQWQTSATTDQHCKFTSPIDIPQLAYQQHFQQQPAYQSLVQDQHLCYSQYYSQPTQSYAQQQTAQYPESGCNYYQQSAQQVQATGERQQYDCAHQSSYPYFQLYGGQQYSQPRIQNCGEMYAQINQCGGQQCQENVEQYSQQEPIQEQSQTGENTTGTRGNSIGANVTGSAVQDLSQEKMLAFYYQQNPAQAQAQLQIEAATATAAASSITTSQHSYEAQWAAYFASQAAFQQKAALFGGVAGAAATYNEKQTYTGVAGAAATYNEQTLATGVVGHNIAAEQMKSSLRREVANIQVPSVGSGCLQQAVGATLYQQQGATATIVYQQQASSAIAPATMYEQPTSDSSGYQQLNGAALIGHGQSMTNAEGYQKHNVAAAAMIPVVVQGQTAVFGVFDYNKRPKY